MDKINLQNLPSRGDNGKVLKSCILPPRGYTMIDADSSQIEARILAWLSGQDNIVRAFVNKEDVYKMMASRIYGVPEDQVTSAQRFVGKQTVLGAGYGMGAKRFKAQLAIEGVEISLDEAARIIKVYREANYAIKDLWYSAQTVLTNMVNDQPCTLGLHNVLEVVPSENAIRMPSGLLMRYEKLSTHQGEKGMQFTYKTRKGPTNIYGGKVVENICQGIAKCAMAEQMLLISKKYPVRLTVHDSAICVVPDEELEEACHFIDACMNHVPEWAPGLPLTGEIEVGKNYGECKEWKPKAPLGHIAQ